MLLSDDETSSSSSETGELAMQSTASNSLIDEDDENSCTKKNSLEETEEVEICYTLDGSYPAEYNSKLMVRVTLCFGFPMVFRAQNWPLNFVNCRHGNTFFSTRQDPWQGT